MFRGARSRSTGESSHPNKPQSVVVVAASCLAYGVEVCHVFVGLVDSSAASGSGKGVVN